MSAGLGGGPTWSAGGAVRSWAPYGDVRRPAPRPADGDGRAFVEELLLTGLTLGDLLSGLLDELPEDAFPGEEPADVLVQMLAGSVAPVLEAAGPQTVQGVTALLGAIRDRAMADLRLPAERAQRS